MKALTVVPGVADSLRVVQLPDPEPGPGELLVAGIAAGVCGTDREIVAGEHGSPPPGRRELVIGHESLGEVLHAPSHSGFTAGDLVVGVVRRPDPVPCGACALGEFDMCRNGRYTERGIQGRDGYASQRWTVDSRYAVRLDPLLRDVGVLLEPAAVVAKAWEQVERVGARSWFAPESVLVTGAGPIGLLAALLGRLRGLDVHVLDRVTGGPKPSLVAAMGATYHHDLATVAETVQPDIVIEATGAASLVTEAMTVTGPYGIVCLTGVSSPGRLSSIDAGAVNREIVLENDVLIGSVNANLRHFRLAAEQLAAADPAWLSGLITRRLPLERHVEAFQGSDDIKVVLSLSG